MNFTSVALATDSSSKARRGQKHRLSLFKKPHSTGLAHGFMKLNQHYCCLWAILEQERALCCVDFGTTRHARGYQEILSASQSFSICGSSVGCVSSHLEKEKLLTKLLRHYLQRIMGCAVSAPSSRTQFRIVKGCPFSGMILKCCVARAGCCFFWMVSTRWTQKESPEPRPKTSRF